MFNRSNQKINSHDHSNKWRNYQSKLKKKKMKPAGHTDVFLCMQPYYAYSSWREVGYSHY
jgi:hypothetical protein